MNKEISWSDFVKQHKKMISDGSWNNWLLFILYYFGEGLVIPDDQTLKKLEDIHG